MKYDEWDVMVLNYRRTDNEKEKNNIYKELRKLYLPKLHSITKEYDGYYHDELLSLYDILLLRAVEGWKGSNNCHFKSYCYIWVTKKLKNTLYEKYIKKDRRYTSLEEYEANHYG